MILVGIGLFLFGFTVIVGGIYIASERSTSERLSQERDKLADELSAMRERHQGELENFIEELKKHTKDGRKFKADVGSLACEGLETDGGHHKQWFLEEIAKKCGTTEAWLDSNVDRGIPA